MQMVCRDALDPAHIGMSAAVNCSAVGECASRNRAVVTEPSVISCSVLFRTMVLAIATVIDRADTSVSVKGRVDRVSTPADSFQWFFNETSLRAIGGGYLAWKGERLHRSRSRAPCAG
jgi:hypothetical protein